EVVVVPGWRVRRPPQLVNVSVGGAEDHVLDAGEDVAHWVTGRSRGTGRCGKVVVVPSVRNSHFVRAERNQCHGLTAVQDVDEITVLWMADGLTAGPGANSLGEPHWRELGKSGLRITVIGGLHDPLHAVAIEGCSGGRDQSDREVLTCGIVAQEEITCSI